MEHRGGSQFHSSENKHAVGAHLSALVKSAVVWADEEKKEEEERKAEKQKPLPQPLFGYQLLGSLLCNCMNRHTKFKK